ncbi:MAG: PDZ domain-containing protein [Planctomycetota bacterium]|jgi:membrane-associated protease RseP (regulator of RpoE activity)
MAIATVCLALLLAAPPADEAKGYIGIQPAPLNAELRKAHKIAEDVKGGLVLLVVHEKTAAAKAGLRPGDVLTSFDNKPLNSIEELMKLLENKKAGQKVAYVARRGSGTIAGLLVLGKRPPESEIIVEMPVDTPKPARQRDQAGEMEARVKALQAEMEALRLRALKKQADARKKAEMKERDAVKAKRKAASSAPRRIQDWLAREERGLVQAEREKKVERVIWHRARLQLLREMGEAGFGRRAQPRGADQRVARLEKRLNQVLERLARLEKQMK